MTADPPGTQQRPARAALAALAERTLPLLLARVDELDEAVAALLTGHHDITVLRHAERAAHQIVGAAGTFGHHRATEIARELEAIFGSSRAEPFELRATGPHTAGRVQALRRELQNSITPAAHDQVAEQQVNEQQVTEQQVTEQQVTEQQVTEQQVTEQQVTEQQVTDEQNRHRLLIATPDGTRGMRLVAAAQVRGLRGLLATDLTAARSALATGRVAAALIDRDLGNADTVELITELSQTCPDAPSLVISRDDQFLDRVSTARAGARGFLSASCSDDTLIGAAADAMSRDGRGNGRLLAVDDDPLVLDVLCTLFTTAGMHLTTENDPLRFWHTLTDTAPDLLLLDLDMPQVTGLELCRLVRADPRWATLPVLVLTGRTGPDAVAQVFSAGADDYVSKPVVAAELLTRVTNRIERVRLYRQLAETDPLTGLANRRKFTADFDRLRLLATRYHQPLSFALLDLDKFKTVNDTYGHAVGDTVLQRLGDVLRRHFRGEDIIARWGGEEISLGLYGMTRDDGVSRVTSALDAIRQETFHTPEHPPLQITFSAGVAEYGPDGDDLHTLYRAADQVLYQAKALGRNQVLPAEPQHHHPTPTTTIID